MRKFLITILALLCSLSAFCDVRSQEVAVVGGDRRLGDYIHLLQGKRVGLLTDHTAVIDDTHIVDTLLKSGVEIKRIFTPDGGFYGDNAQAHRDSYLGVEIVILDQEPKANDVFGCDVVVCDVRDEGVRWSPALQALVRIMQVCGDIGVPLVVLDSPNPFGDSVDGAIAESPFRGGGVLPLPLLYGMTLGELSLMISGEGWLAGGAKVSLTVVPCLNYARRGEFTPEVLSRGLCVEVPIVENGKISLSRVVSAYAERSSEEEFFVGEEFDVSMGVSYVREMITYGYTAEEIESVWRDDVSQFIAEREEYLIYEN